MHVALYVAVHLSLFRLLTEAVFEMNVKSRIGRTPLVCAHSVFSEWKVSLF